MVNVFWIMLIYLTALYSIADTINSRPLTYVSSDELLSPLTPNHFTRFRSSDANLPINVNNNTRTDYTGRNVRELWGHVTGVIENFWNVFKNHCLTLLRERYVRSHTSDRGSLAQIPKVNQVVLVKEPGEHRASWKLGKILILDHRSAVATILVDKVHLTRSIFFNH